MTDSTPLTEAAAPAPASGAPTASEWTDRYRGSLLDVFGPPQRVMVRGEGCHLWDADGNRYLDLLAGIAVDALGHAHPRLVDAVTRQMRTLGHVSNFFATPPQVELAERLLGLLAAPAGSAVFLANSGTEANEAALKLSRRTGRTRLLALENGFHGRSTGALALTHKPAHREPFAPLLGEVTFVPADDVAALERELAGDDVAALFLEPIQGEAGVRPLSAEYLRAARAATSAHGTLLIVDEVQSGVGRTGDWFAHRGLTAPEPIVPDAVTLAKGLAGGFPIGAMLTVGTAATALLGPGQHGTTFGGNPVACAAALAVLDTIEADGLLENASAVGHAIRREVADLGDDRVLEVRGAGLLLGIVLATPVAAQVRDAAYDAGFVVNATGPDVIRLVPPLILTADQAREFVAALPSLLDAAEQANAPTA